MRAQEVIIIQMAEYFKQKTRKLIFSCKINNQFKNNFENIFFNELNRIFILLIILFERNER